MDLSCLDTCSLLQGPDKKILCQLSMLERVFAQGKELFCSSFVLFNTIANLHQIMYIFLLSDCGQNIHELLELLISCVSWDYLLSYVFPSICKFDLQVKRMRQKLLRKASNMLRKLLHWMSRTEILGVRFHTIFIYFHCAFYFLHYFVLSFVFVLVFLSLL